MLLAPYILILCFARFPSNAHQKQTDSVLPPEIFLFKTQESLISSQSMKDIGDYSTKAYQPIPQVPENDDISIPAYKTFIYFVTAEIPIQ